MPVILELKAPDESPLLGIPFVLHEGISEARIQRKVFDLISGRNDLRYRYRTVWAMISEDDSFVIATWNQAGETWVPGPSSDKKHILTQDTYFGLTNLTGVADPDMSIEEFDSVSVMSAYSQPRASRESPRVRELRVMIEVLAKIQALNEATISRPRGDQSSVCTSSENVTIADLVESGFFAGLKTLPTDEKSLERARRDLKTHKISYKESDILGLAALKDWRAIGAKWEDVPDYGKKAVLSWYWPGKSSINVFCKWGSMNKNRGEHSE